MPTHHTLKTDEAAYKAVRRGDKNFEVRKDDRMYQAGDAVTLQHHDPNTVPNGFRPPWPAGQEPNPDLGPFVIGFVLRGGQYGVEPGYVAFSLLPKVETTGKGHEVPKNDRLSGGF
jgi:hypothetical protein